MKSEKNESLKYKIFKLFLNINIPVWMVREFGKIQS